MTKIARRPLDARRLFRWDATFQGWTHRFVAANLWRVAHLGHTHDDAVQECAMVFARVVNKYAATPHMNQRWMMALYKRAVANHFHSASNAATGARETFVDLGENRSVETIAPAAGADEGPNANGLLARAYAFGSDELRAALGVIFNGPSELLDIVFKDGDPEGINRRLARVARVRSGRNLLDELRGLLGA